MSKYKSRMQECPVNCQALLHAYPDTWDETPCYDIEICVHVGALNKLPSMDTLNWFSKAQPKSFIHLFSFHFSWWGSKWQGRLDKTFLYPVRESSSYWGIPKTFPSQLRDTISPVGPAPGSPHSAVGCAWSWRSQPRSKLVQCPNHFNWFLLIWRSNCSTLRLSFIVELLTLSQRVNPVISTNCTHDHNLSVSTHNTWL